MCTLIILVLINPYMTSCSTGNLADGSDTDDAKQFITSTNKKAAIKVIEGKASLTPFLATDFQILIIKKGCAV